MYLIEDPQDIQYLAVKDPSKLFYVSQTTLSVDETKDIISHLKNKYPEIQGPKKDDICYATQNRQDAVKSLAEQCSLIFVVGSRNSSNSNRLKELAEKCGSQAYLIDNSTEIEDEWLKGIDCVGVTAGASAPEILVNEVLDKLKSLGGEMSGLPTENNENMYFPVPQELR